VAASPRSGINTITGEGLKEATAGTQVVIDLANSPSFEDNAVLKFFETSGRNILAAEAAANVRHHVALSIVATDRTDNGYFRAKVAQEKLIETYVKLVSDLLNVDRRALVGKARLSGNDEQRPEPRQRCDDAFDQSVGEVILTGIIGQVLERKHGNRRPVGPDGRYRRCIGDRIDLSVDFADGTHEAEPLALQRLDQALLTAAVSDRCACRVDPGRQRRVGDDTALPHGGN
jgi:hypothetical protein